MRWNSRSGGASKNTPSNGNEEGSDEEGLKNSRLNAASSSHQMTGEDSKSLNMSSSLSDLRTTNTRTTALGEDDSRFLDDDDDDNDDEPDHNSSNISHPSQYDDDDDDDSIGHPITDQQHQYPHTSVGPASLSASRLGSSMRSSMSSPNIPIVGSIPFNPTKERRTKRNTRKHTTTLVNTVGGLDSGYESPPPHPSLFSSDPSFSQAQNYNSEVFQQLPKSNSDPGALSIEALSSLPTSAVLDRLHVNGNSTVEGNPTVFTNSSSTAAPESLSSSHSVSNSSSSSTPPPSAAVIEDDDPGLDHALPPDECAGSLTPSNVWRPQNQQSTCEFTHTIKLYSQKRESGCKKAEYSATTVDVHGNRWRLIVYVNGNGRASNHHLSLFLQVADADELPFGWKKAVSYVLTLEHPSGTNLGYAKRNPDKTFKLCPKAIDWGWSQFITSDRIQQEGYVHNDSLIVRASVTVKSSSVSIDVDDAELYLKCAVEEGNADAVKACLAQGAGVNCQFKDDLYTPLHTACSSSTSRGSLEVLKLLLERGADGNACNKWRETPLLIAANNGHRAAVEALLEHGADPSLCSEAGWSALTFAAHKGYDEIVSLLLASGAPVNCKVTEDLSTPLHKACAGGKSGHLSAVRQLLQGGADVHALNKWRETPLLTAANHGQAAAVEALLRNGGDPCKCTDTGWSPLSIAAYKGHDDVVRLLLEEGAPTEEADPTLSALLQAATKGLPDTVELLLRHGADHTVTTKKGDTALSILVEQNLIDAAVEMVTEYKASVPRCSRDRKKVQRARLLINLRVKQQQKEGLLNGAYNNDGDTESDDSEQDDFEDNPNLALHRSLDSPITHNLVSTKKKKKKKSKLKTRENAEAEAKAAEEALLLELEKEDEQAQKEEAAATSKRAKKKKKRERERQQRLKEERLRQEKERKERMIKEAEEKRKQQLQREKEEQEKIKKEREEMERKIMLKKEAEEREKKQRREQQEREKKEKENEKRKEKEQLEQRRQLEEKEKKEKFDRMNKKSSKGSSPPFPNAPPAKQSIVKNKDVKPKSIVKKMPYSGDGLKTTDAINDTSKPTVNASYTNNDTAKIISSKSHSSKKRGWEIKVTPSDNQTSRSKESYLHSPRTPSLKKDFQENELDNKNSTTYAKPTTSVSVEDELENMANGVVDFLGFDSPPQIANDHRDNVSLDDGKSSFHHVSKISIELPSVSIFQEEKVAELLNRSLQMGIISDDILRSVIYRYMIRASHSSSEFLDPVIPSWTDKGLLISFLQRQLISENRKVGTSPTGGGVMRMELLKEAGTTLADLCLNLAKEVSQFRLKSIEQIPSDWSDEMIGLRAEQQMTNGHGFSAVVLDWSGSRQVKISSESYENLRHRYCGPQRQFLSAIFSAAKRYEIRRLVAGPNADLHLTRNTIATLCKEANVSIEIWTNPLAVFGNNAFLGAFPDVDAPFRGLPPFGKESGGGECLILEHGGSVAMLPPLESATAGVYIRTVVDLLERAENSNVPLSFAIFLPYECFRELTAQPNMNDLRLLDPRLGDICSKFVIHAEPLNEGQYLFSSGERTEVNSSGSVFALLQNHGGKTRYPVSKRGIANILQSLSVNISHLIDTTVTSVGSSNFSELSDNPIGNSHHLLGNSDIFSRSFSSEPRSRRGRFFELEESGEDETVQDVEVMRGMYANLNMSMFQNSTQDVDIENLALLGIGGGIRDESSRDRGRFG